MKIIVTGHKGMLGRDLLLRMEKAGFDVKGVDIDGLDITRLDDVMCYFESIHPDIVINCAAYTAVDKAESEPKIAFSVNKNGPENLALACKQFRLPLIHISTDYVFDGRAKEPYKEDDPVNPLGVYGRSKWEGEESVRAYLKEQVIIRTSWLYGIHGHNFAKTILRLANEKKEIRVVDDQKGCPTWTGDLSAALVKLVKRICDNPSGIPWGTYHFCGNGSTSWYEFARAIIEEAKKYNFIRIPNILPIQTSDYPTPAKRPMWSVMDCSKILNTFGLNTSEWKNGVITMLEELYNDENKKYMTL